MLLSQFSRVCTARRRSSVSPLSVGFSCFALSGVIGGPNINLSRWRLPLRQLNKRGKGRCGGKMVKAPTIRTGTSGALASIASRAAPPRNGPSFPVRVRVPSGWMSRGRPSVRTLAPDRSAGKMSPSRSVGMALANWATSRVPKLSKCSRLAKQQRLRRKSGRRTDATRKKSK